MGVNLPNDHSRGHLHMLITTVAGLWDVSVGPLTFALPLLGQGLGQCGEEFELCHRHGG